MKYLFGIVQFLVLLGQTSMGFAQSSYTINAKASEINFEISHMKVMTVKGCFHDFGGEVIADKTSIKEISSKINVKSIDTKDTSRDKSLLNDKYFDAETFPFISFKSLHIRSTDSGYVIDGLLKIKDVEKKITFPYKVTREDGVLHFYADTVINRKDFNLKFGLMDTLVGKEVNITLKIVAEE